jgi:hypothetical protein
VTQPFPSGDILGTDGGRFFFYAVTPTSAPLVVTLPRQSTLAGSAQVTVSASAPVGLTLSSAHVTTTMPGFLLETSPLTPTAGSLSYRYDPVILARSFPTLNVSPPADVVTITLFGSGTDAGGGATYAAKVLALHGADLFNLPLPASLTRTSTNESASVAARGGTSIVSSGTRPASREMSAVADAPSSVRATASGSGVVLTWVGPSGVTPARYVISGGTAPDASTLPVIVTPDASTGYTIPALPPGTYYFRVSAISPSGLSSASGDAAVVARGSASATGPPSGALASADGLDITVAWTPAERVPSVYQVEIGSAPGQADMATLTTTQPSVTYRGTSATYYLRVRAALGAAVSEPSNEVSVPVASAVCTAAPLSPILLPLSTTHGETTVSWLAAEGAPADYYRVDGTGPSGPMTTTSLGNGTSLTARLRPGTYAIRVTAINTCGASGPSNQIGFTEPDLASGPIGN